MARSDKIYLEDQAAANGLQIAAYYYDARNRRGRKTIIDSGLKGNIPNGTTDYPGAAAQTSMGRSGLGAGGKSIFCVEQSSPASSTDAAILRDTYNGGVLPTNGWRTQ